MATPIKAETMENPTPFTTDHLGEQLHRHDNVKRGGDLGGLEALVGKGFGDLATARQKAEQEAPPDDPPVSTDKDAPEKSEPGSEDRDADAGEDPGQQQKGDEDDPYADRNFYDDDDDFGETEDWNQFNQTLDDAIEDAEEDGRTQQVEPESEEKEEEAEAEAELDPEDGDEDAETEETADFLEGDEEITDADRKRIKEDPSLQKHYRDMKRVFARKSTELAQQRQTVEAQSQQVAAFSESLKTPEGVRDFIGYVMHQRPDVVGHAFEIAATGDRGIEFLTEVGLEKPELLAKAHEIVTDLRSDETAMLRHKNLRDIRSRERALDERDRAQKDQRTTADFVRLKQMARNVARRHGMKDEDFTSVTTQLEAMCRSRMNDDGSINVSDAEIKTLVKGQAGQVKEQEARIEKRVRKELAAESQQKTRKKARTANKRTRTAPPQSRRQKRPQKKGRFKPPKGADALGAFVSHEVNTRM